MKTKKTMSLKQYMDLQIRFLLFISQVNNIDNLTAAEIYAPRLAEKIRSKYDLEF